MTDTAVVAGNGAVATQDEIVEERVPPQLPPEEPDNPIGRGMLLGLAIIAIAAIGVAAAYFLTHRDKGAQTTTTITTVAEGTTTAAAGAGQTVAVPEVVGLSQQEALIRLGKAGLRPKIERRADGPADGRVVSQRPARSSKVALGAPVTILVDRLKAGAVAPAPKAKTAPTPAATTTTATTTTAAATPAPAPAPTTASVPDLSGKDEQAAAQALNDAGLLASIVFVPSQDTLGTVEGQGRDAGSNVPAKSTVQINISRGPGDKPDETVPDVSGKTLPEAVSTIQGAQLRLIFLKTPVTTRDQAGKIVKQTPMPGAHAPQNGQVLVYMGAFHPNG